MITVGAFEAKTHLSSLLDKVAAGEEVIITKHGKAVARLVKAQTHEQDRVNSAITQLRKLRQHTSLGDFSWQKLRDEGRR
jgi:prevent-host-death family protein